MGVFLGIIGVIVVYSKPVRYGNDASISENEKIDDTKFAEIKEYKELLDSGIITPEEFEKKKSELLDLS